jgi:hypothetical protein
MKSIRNTTLKFICFRLSANTFGFEIFKSRFLKTQFLSFGLGLMLIIFLSSCKKDPSKYDLPIERQKLNGILLDLYLAGAATEMDTLPNKDSIKQVYLTEICRIHKITEEDLKKTLARLNEKYVINGVIQREILDSLAVMNYNSQKK